MFSANNLFLLSRTECPSCPMFPLRDLNTQRAYRLYDFIKAQLIRPNVAYCLAGNVDRAGELHLVIESVPSDTKHDEHSIVPVPTDGAGGLVID